MSSSESSEAEGSSFIGSICHGLFSLFSFLLRTGVRFGITLGLVASVLITLYAVGKLSKDAVKERKQVLDLIYWRDPKKSAVVLSLSLLTLIVFAKFPLITVLSYAGLAVLGGTLGFRIYKAVEAQIKKTDSANPFQPYLESEVSIPQERIHKQVDVFLEHSQLVVTQLRRLFLVEDIVDSVKFGVLLWALTYIGYWFSGLCLLMLIVIAVFSVPKIYEVYQEPIDRTLAVAKEHANNVSNIISEKVPFLKKQVHEKST